MKTLIYCFSGTGNTLKACEELKDALNTLGHETDVFRLMPNSEPPAPQGYDRLIVAYPVHAFNAPAPFLKFLKRLPKGNKTLPTYLLRTSGEPLKLNHASGITPKRILRRRGYPVRGEFAYVMPYNIIFRHPDGMAARMRRAMKLQIEDAAKVIAEGTGRRIKNGPFRRVVSFVLRIEHTAMPLIGRRFRAAEGCTGCGLCERVCPQGNIKIVDGKPKFGKTCAGCMGCAFLCPKDALRISVLNGWRVNGNYTFDGVPATDDEVCNYCHKSYVRYFHSAEDK